MQRGRLAGARRADDHVPGQGVQAVAAAALLERGHGFFEAFPQLLRFGRRPLLLLPRLAQYRADQIGVRTARAQPFEQRRHDPPDDDQRDGDQPCAFAFRADDRCRTRNTVPRTR